METKQLTDVIEKAIERKLGNKEHLESHQKCQRIGHEDVDFLIAAREFVEAIKDTFWKTLIRCLVILSLSIITGGIYAYFKYKHH